MSATAARPPLKNHVVVAAVEGGGTSFRVAACRLNLDDRGSDDGKNRGAVLPTILHRTEVDSSGNDPSRTLAECCQFLKRHKPEPEGYRALGLATFGPVGLQKSRPEEYGRILKSSPKASWRNVDLLGPLREACQGTVPLRVKVETDVNAPALAEYLVATSGAEDDATGTSSPPPKITSAAYVTVGTGVGVGLVVNGRPVHGRMHPEGGHVPVHPLEGDEFPGYSWGKQCSPFKGVHTVEGLACSVSLTERLQYMQQQQQQQQNKTPDTDITALPRSVLKDLPDDHEIWDHAANALAGLCATLLLTLSIERIAFGGGIVQRRGLMDQVRSRTVELLNGYLELPDDMSELVMTSRFGPDAGLIGSVVLAQDAYLSGEDDVGDDGGAAKTKKAKQEAYGVGLWHGIVVGAVASGLLFKYVFRTNRGRRY